MLRCFRGRRIEVFGDLRLLCDGYCGNSSCVDVDLAAQRGLGDGMTSTGSRILHHLTATGTVLAGLSAMMSIGNALFMPRLRRTGAGKPHDRVVVCIPARDEESTVPLLIADLREQTYGGELRVIVLDDGSVTARWLPPAAPPTAIRASPSYRRALHPVLVGRGKPQRVEPLPISVSMTDQT